MMLMMTMMMISIRIENFIYVVKPKKHSVYKVDSCILCLTFSELFCFVRTYTGTGYLFRQKKKRDETVKVYKSI